MPGSDGDVVSLGGLGKLKRGWKLQGSFASLHTCVFGSPIVMLHFHDVYTV